MTHGAPVAGQVALPAELASVPAARRFAVGCLSEASDEARDAVALLTAELVTNAILHALSPVLVTVTRADGLVRVSVHDDERAVPIVHDHGADASTGRGMRLVQAISTAWGVDPEPVGKTVWFEVGEHTSGADAEASFATVWADIEPL